MNNTTFGTALTALILSAPLALAQTAPQAAATTAQTASQTDSSYIDSKGTAHVTRVIPVPDTVSPQAQAVLARSVSDAPRNESLADRRAHTDAWQARAGAASKAVYPVNIANDKIAGVPVLIVTPPAIGSGKSDRVLICVHGGVFISITGRPPRAFP